MTFEEVCNECLKNDDLLKQFNRLCKHKLGEKRKPIEIMIDDACGRNPDEDAMIDFLDFVYEYIWMPLRK